MGLCVAPFCQDFWDPNNIESAKKISNAIKTINDFFTCAEEIRQDANNLKTDTEKHCVASCRVARECYGQNVALAIGILKEGLDLISPILAKLKLKEKPDNPEWRDIQNDYEGVKCAKSPKSCKECCDDSKCKKY